MATANESKVGLIQTIAIAIGFSISGSLFVSPVVAASVVGPAAIPLVLVAAVGIFLALPVYIILAKTWPVSPGHYYYPARLLFPENERISQLIAWTVSWALVFTFSFFVFQYLVTAAAAFLNGFFPAISVSLFIALLLTVSVIVVWFGIELVGWIEVILVSIMLLTIALFSVVGLLNVTTDNFTPILPTGVTSVLPMTGVLYTLMLGGLFVIDFSGDLEDAETNAGRAVIIGTLSEILPTLLVAIVVIGTVSYTQLEDRTIAFVAQQFLTGPARSFVIFGALVATVTTSLAFVTLILRHANVGFEEGILPTRFGHKNKHGEVIVPLLVMYVIALATIPLELPLETMATTYNFGLMTLVTLVTLVGVRLPSTVPEIFEQESVTGSRFLRPQVVRWSSLFAAVVIVSILANTAITNPVSFMWYTIFLLSGVTIYAVRWWQNRGRDSSLVESKNINL